MIRNLLTLLLLLAGTTQTVANFGWFRRPTSASYYAAPTMVILPAVSAPAPLIYQPDPSLPEPEIAPLAIIPHPAIFPAPASPGLSQPSTPFPTVPVLPEPPSPRAIPTPAPPSMVRIPIREERTPVRSAYQPSVSFSPSREAAAKDSEYHCTIRNQAEQALFVRVNGVRYVLVPGQSVTVAVQTQFVWKIEGREAEKGTIPVGEKGLAIVINR